MYAFRQEQEEFTKVRPQAALIDPAVIRAAGQIYHIYCEVHPEITGQATGVAIKRTNLRGKVIFIENPALLPDECFIPLSQIESYVY